MAMDRISRINPLLEILRSSPQRVNKILIQKDSNKQDIAEIVRLSKLSHISLQFVPKKRLDLLDKKHQGVVALVMPKAFVSVDSILESAKLPFLLLLDGVVDPQNLGAIIRTAEGAGIDGLVLPERRAAGVTGAVASVSAGAVEHLKISRVTNLVRAMDDLRKRGVWLVGAEGGGQEYWYDFDYTVPLGLVLGSEGKGLRPLVKANCDRVLSIPLMGKLTSLNVAAAAAIFCFEVVRQRKKYLSKT
ncbi:23S rRNA (guanosine(2251)-2'-O)-methyltransferase RlmB [Acidobacteriota bacterium]